MDDIQKKIPLYIAWVQSIVAMSGSLFFSEVMKLPPCVLCWYQRICMYPLVLLLAVGIFLKDKKVVFYTLPLAVIGWSIALYHNLLYYHVIPESYAPCQNGVSCTTKLITWFGFVTIPLLSFMAFTIIIACLVFYTVLDTKVNKT